MIISFFLLLISTSHNIRDNIQEFGCLRAMGLTKNQGVRMFMYEQYSVIFSALFLGLIIGIILAALVGGQFFMFIELPAKMLMPTRLVIAMVFMSIITTFFAVYIPLKEVNKK
jgi:ABC-type antimicrobial peptide transport system permease subunit